MFDFMPDYTVETEPSLEGLLRWLESQPPETEYDHWSTTDCLLCRYGRHIGIFDEKTDFYVDLCNRLSGGDSDEESRWLEVAFGSVETLGTNYAAAAARCRALLERQ